MEMALHRTTESSVNVGPLLVTLAVVFAAYFTAALAFPAMPAAVHHALASIPALKGNPHETLGCDLSLARADDVRFR